MLRVREEGHRFTQRRHRVALSEKGGIMWLGLFQFNSGIGSKSKIIYTNFSTLQPLAFAGILLNYFLPVKDGYNFIIKII